ncbi:MAG: AMP-binding protein [Clostridiales Family XIII bacterium]|jgi:long-chain acyl-CoA synthetase|nr:AMP-binding protein [Clostridiales Family XIII bacterium]
MNSAKYKNVLYERGAVTNLKDLVNTSVAIYGERTAYLVKHTPGGAYEPISFAELKEDLDGLGTALAEIGLRGKKVAVIGENRYEWVLSYLAVVNGGGVIIPLDRELGGEEIARILKRAGADAIVFSSKVEAVVEEAATSLPESGFLISMDASEHEGRRKSLRRLVALGKKLLRERRLGFIDFNIDADAMCALLFTSGTTGLSKGVMLSHRNIAANVHDMSKYVNVENFTGLSVLPMHHTYEMTCHIMTALYQGCAVAICEGLKYIVKNMSESKASLMLGVPLIFENMHKKIWKNAESGRKADKMRKVVQLSKLLGGQNIKHTKKLFKDVHNAMGGNVRLFISGGAAIDPAVVEDFNAMGFTMIQGYGMTENAPLIAMNKDRYSKAAAAGLPLPGTEVQIIDKDKSGIGEIICRGDSVMLGYYADPEETARVIVDGWLHTGDFGYLDKDGFLYVTGRKKNIIVTKNGKNISPEELEYYLLKSPYIQEAVVWGKPDERSGDLIINAAVVPDLEFLRETQMRGDQDEASLRKILSEEIDAVNEKMPPYKRIKKFVLRTEEFEKTSTKKIKRHLAAHG